MPTYDERALSIAVFRHHLIADALEAEGEGVAAELRAVAATPHWDPNQREVRVSMATLWRWLAAYRQGGILALQPKPRKDRGALRAFSKAILDHAVQLRQEGPKRSTRTIIKIMVAQKVVRSGQISRATLDRHFDRLDMSRKRQGTLAQKTFRRIRTDAPMELVITDFHHGPYVREGPDGEISRAKFSGFIDHYSRAILEGRYNLTEDFVAFRFGFRRLLGLHGLPKKLFLDNGAAYRSLRLRAGCASLGINMVHSRPYVAESRGAIERFNRTLSEQFEYEVSLRPTTPTLEELNAWLQAWLAQSYHRDIHSETKQSPAERFEMNPAAGSPCPPLEVVEEYLRIQETRKVHRQWSTVEVGGTRYVVSSELRGRKVTVLYDPSDPAYVLIATPKGGVLQRAMPQVAGEVPPSPTPTQGGKSAPATHGNYLDLMLAEHEQLRRAELGALRMHVNPHPEVDLPGLAAHLQVCRGGPLTDAELSSAAAFIRRLKPLDPDEVRRVLESARRKLGQGLHLSQYLDVLEHQIVRKRAEAVPSAPTKGKNS
jgi:putative transposase